MITSMRVSHFNGTASTTVAKISANKLAQRVYIRNVGGTNAIQVSFDGGANFLTIPASGEFEGDVLCHYFFIQSAASTSVYSGLFYEG
jgi:hypothetical protein